MIRRQSTNNKILEIKDENGEIIDETSIPDAFSRHFVELGRKFANEIPRLIILPADSFLSDVHHLVNGFPGFQEISENDVLKLLYGLGPKKASGIDGISSHIIKISASNSYFTISNTNIQPVYLNRHISQSPMIGKLLESLQFISLKLRMK